MNSLPDSTAPADEAQPLVRSLGPWQATSLNVANMVGIGPFITIPLFIESMNGPHALVGWVAAAILVLCDGLVWSELGAAIPGSGGSYHFLREIFGRYSWGRIVPFLFIWQFLVSGALELASGYIGAMSYLAYVFPALGSPGPEGAIVITAEAKWLAALCAIGVSVLLCQNIRNLGKLSIVLCAGTLATVLTVIVAGLANFDASLFTMPKGGVKFDATLAMGLGAAMTIAVYDYLGYYNICHLGDEVRDPGRTIPRAVMFSVLIVAAIYLTMNVAIIGVVPWQEAMKSTNIAADFMEKLYGRPMAVGFTFLILWTVLACVFVMTLGYSRIPYAAARNGDFFRPFAYIHPRGRFPLVSLAALGLLTAAFCFLSLDTVIKAAVCVRILVQFIGQIAALHLFRQARPAESMPFRMWFYPLPSLVALAGWIFLLATSDPEVLQLCGGVLASGVVVFSAWRLLAPKPKES